MSQATWLGALAESFSRCQLHDVPLLCLSYRPRLFKGPAHCASQGGPRGGSEAAPLFICATRRAERPSQTTYAKEAGWGRVASSSGTPICQACLVASIVCESCVVRCNHARCCWPCSKAHRQRFDDCWQGELGGKTMRVQYQQSVRSRRAPHKMSLSSFAKFVSLREGQCAGDQPLNPHCKRGRYAPSEALHTVGAPIVMQRQFAGRMRTRSHMKLYRLAVREQCMKVGASSQQTQLGLVCQFLANAFRFEVAPPPPPHSPAPFAFRHFHLALCGAPFFLHKTMMREGSGPRPRSDNSAW